MGKDLERNTPGGKDLVGKDLGEKRPGWKRPGWKKPGGNIPRGKRPEGKDWEGKHRSRPGIGTDTSETLRFWEHLVLLENI